MTAKLEKEIATLSPAEKRELIDALWMQLEVSGEESINPDLLSELERRAEAHEKDPSGSMTLEEFDRKWLARK